MLQVPFRLIKNDCPNLLFLSNPKQSYWSWSLLFSRVCLVIGSFGIAMVAAFGLFNTSQFHGELLGPFVSVAQVFSFVWEVTPTHINVVGSWRWVYFIICLEYGPRSCYEMGAGHPCWCQVTFPPAWGNVTVTNSFYKTSASWSFNFSSLTFLVRQSSPI